jgi:DNA-binding transcriptional LysR family regulator
MIDWILRGEADLAAVIMPPLNHPDLEVRTLSEEEMVFVGAPWADEGALLAALETGRLEEGFIFTEQGCSYRIVVEHFFRSRGLVPERTMELWSMEAIKRCVQSGLGISFVPRMYVEGDLRRGTLRELAAPLLGEVFRIQLAWRKNRRLSPAAREFVRIARENARSWSGTAEKDLPPVPSLPAPEGDRIRTA